MKYEDFINLFFGHKWKFISMRKKPVQQVKRQAAEQKHLITKAKDMHIWRMQLSETQQILTVLRSHEVLFNYDVAFHSKRVKCMFVYDFQIDPNLWSFKIKENFKKREHQVLMFFFQAMEKFNHPVNWQT